jgi:hypothetical protein
MLPDVPPLVAVVRRTPRWKIEARNAAIMARKRAKAFGDPRVEGRELRWPVQQETPAVAVVAKVSSRDFAEAWRSLASLVDDLSEDDAEMVLNKLRAWLEGTIPQAEWLKLVGGLRALKRMGEKPPAPTPVSRLLDRPTGGW